MSPEEFDRLYALSVHRLVHRLSGVVGEDAARVVDEAFTLAWARRRPLAGSDAEVQVLRIAFGIASGLLGPDAPRAIGAPNGEALPPGVPAPPPPPGRAASLRAAGDRLRRRRRTVAGLVAVAVVAALAIPTGIWLTRSEDREAGRDRADAPTSTPVAVDDLLVDADTRVFDAASWVGVDTSDGDGQAPAHRCQGATLASLGADQVRQRSFELRADDGPSDGPVDGALLVESIASFASDTEARSAFDTATTWFTDCSGQLSDYADVEVPRESEDVPLDGAQARTGLITFGPAEDDPSGDSQYFLEYGVVRTGDRIAVLSHQIVGQDYNVDVTPVVQMLPRAAERLRPGGEAPPATPSTPSTAASSAAPVDLDTFDLTAGMLQPDDGSAPETGDDEVVGDLGLCGRTPEKLQADAVDRRSASAVGPGYGEQRELLAYADEDAARAAVAEVAELAGACPTQDVGGTTWLTVTSRPDVDPGLETVLLIRSYEDGGTPVLGSDVHVLVRSGPVVLLVHRGDEADSTPEQAGNQLLEDLSRSWDELTNAFGR